MRRIGIGQAQPLREWFRPERSGPLTGMHVLQTGHGSVWVDTWPSPRAVVVESGANVGLAGDPRALSAEDVRQTVFGFIEPAAGFEDLLRQSFPNAVRWPRVVLRHSGKAALSRPTGLRPRRLHAADAPAIQALDRDLAWISVTWGGPAGLARSGYAWGAFVEDRLVAVACSFFVGERYEDIGIVTAKEHRGRGLATLCATQLANDILRRKRRPSWTTTPDNPESLRVAEKLGFVFDRDDELLIVGRSSGDGAPAS